MPSSSSIPLNNQRYQAADKALSDYDFGLMITDTGQWISDEHNRLSCRVLADDEQGMAVPLVFHVDFPDGQSEPAGAFAYDLRDGTEIGAAQ